jgi:hypothetical protein
MWLLFVKGDISLPPQNRSTIMTNELSLDTLDQVSGGLLNRGQEGRLLAIEQAEGMISANQAARYMRLWETAQLAKELKGGGTNWVSFT